MILICLKKLDHLKNNKYTNWVGDKRRGKGKYLGRTKIGESRLTRLSRKHVPAMNTTIGSFKYFSLCSADPVREDCCFDPFIF